MPEVCISLSLRTVACIAGKTSVIIGGDETCNFLLESVIYCILQHRKYRREFMQLFECSYARPKLLRVSENKFPFGLLNDSSMTGQTC